jgi:hypothetical protein
VQLLPQFAQKFVNQLAAPMQQAGSIGFSEIALTDCALA